METIEFSKERFDKERARFKIKRNRGGRGLCNEADNELWHAMKSYWIIRLLAYFWREQESMLYNTYS